jgi:FtsP/CotA-like multicopper oxidase with cupredoxin domain
MLHAPRDGRKDGDRGAVAPGRRLPPPRLLAVLGIGVAAVCLVFVAVSSRAQRPSPHAGDPLAEAARAHAIKSLTEFDTGKATRLPDGRTLREYWVETVDKVIEVAPGVRFPAWTFNGAVPGPTIRCTEGDSVVVHFTNKAPMPHSMHFHGIHAANMDGVFEQVPPGASFTYAFTAKPFGLHVYHCHTMPVKMHIARGLYGVFLVDPKTPRPKAREMVMVMNGFDTDLNGEDNEFYSVNGFANVFFRDYPIPVKMGELQRVYLVNMTEFDLLNSMHTHATFFHVYPTGTSTTPSLFTDTFSMGQGERAILEFKYDTPGRFLFHAHQNEFAELGWLGQFEVKP